MAKSVSASKRVKQNIKRKISNVRVKSELKTLEKRYRTLVKNQEKEQIISFFRVISSKFDTAARKRIIHKNKAARKKSILSRLFLK